MRRTLVGMAIVSVALMVPFLVRADDQKIAEAKKLDRLAVKVSRAGGGLRITVPAGDIRDRATVWLAVFDRRHDTEIKRGENSGSTLSY